MTKIKRTTSSPTQEASGSTDTAAPVGDFGSNAEMLEQLQSAQGCNPDLKTDVLSPTSISSDFLMGGPAAAVGGVLNNVSNTVVSGLAEDLGAPCAAVDTFRGLTTMLNPTASGEDIVEVMEAFDPVYHEHYDAMIDNIKSPDKQTLLGKLADGPGAWLGAPFDWISSKL